jgi:hypothetical protein
MTRKTYFWSRAIAVGLLIAEGLLLLPRPAIAQTPKALNMLCEETVVSAKQRFEHILRIAVDVDKKDNADFYSDLPKGRSIDYDFSFLPPYKNGYPDYSGVENGVRNIENSPQLLLSISKDIITNCPLASSVTFRLSSELACPPVYGLMSDGTVKRFAWITRGQKQNLKWGSTYCFKAP